MDKAHNKTASLFTAAPAPLAERLRPQTFAEIVGQPHLTGKNGLITRIVASGTPVSLILWGPPGCGKTTLARLYARAFEAEFIQVSAVLTGAPEIKRMAQAAEKAQQTGRRTVLFVDEIHRFNKLQQDAFLPFVESGALILIGATTENPSFSLNNALLSRAQVLVLNSIDDKSLEDILNKSLHETGVQITDDTRHNLIAMSDGDGRSLINMVETLAAAVPGQTVTPELLATTLTRRAPLYDKTGDGHYNLISALHKAVRGSDPEASLYWLCRMLEGGEDPRFLARRLIRMSVEDIGLADPHALPLAEAAARTYDRLGTPEGELALAEITVYLALAPKSNAIYTAYGNMRKLAQESGSKPPPAIILNAPTKLMEEQGYGEGYLYDHDQPDAFSGQNYFPPGMKRPNTYKPVDRGFERDMKKRIDYFEKLRKKKNN